MIENAPGIYNAPSVYNQGGGGLNIGNLPKDKLKFAGIEYDLIFFCGLIITKQNLKYPVDLGTHCFYPNGDSSKLDDYGYLYDDTARNAINGNVNNLPHDWGTWSALDYYFMIFDMRNIFWNKYTNDELRYLINFIPAGLRRSNGTFAGFGNSMCIGYGDVNDEYLDVPSSGSVSRGMAISNASTSMRLVLVKP